MTDYLWLIEEPTDEDLIELVYDEDLSELLRSDAVEFARRANLSLVVFPAQKLRNWMNPRSL